MYRYGRQSLAFLAGLLLAGVAAAQTGSSLLTWTPPARNTDGSNLTDLAGYRVYWGTAPGHYPSSATLSNPGLTSYVVDQLTPATWYFVVTALNVVGVESSFSNIASKTIVGEPLPQPEPIESPGPVRNLEVTPVDPAPTAGIGFNFRATAAFATDPPGTTHALATDRYPTTRAGRTFGWVGNASVEGRDRAGADPRLRGVVQNTVAGTRPLFAIDLPTAGRYRVCLAAGDNSFANWASFTILDDTSIVYTQSQLRTPAGSFADASGALRTAAAWASSAQCRELDFATNRFGITLNGPTGGNASVLAHLSVAQVQ